MVANTAFGAIAALLLLCTASVTAGRQLHSTGSRIFNGIDADALPSVDPAFNLTFVVAFYLNTALASEGDAATPFCTGTLVTSNKVLTAAHCFYGDGEFNAATQGASVRVEGDQSRLIPITQIAVHPEYIHSSADAGSAAFAPYDVAVAMLAEDSTVAPVGAVAGLGYMPPVGEPLIIAGYGDTNQTDLEDGTGATNTLNAAVVEYLGDLCPTGAGGTVCAGGDANTCQGDSGGPLLAFDTTDETFFVLGITSYGDYCGRQAAAGQVEYGYYTDVRVHFDAINALIAQLDTLAA